MANKPLLFSLVMTLCLLQTTIGFSQGPPVIGIAGNSGSTGAGRTSSGMPAPDQRGWTDPALNHNKLIQQTSDGKIKLIGPYKVTGSSFLFGERNKGDMYSSEAKAQNIYLSYNTYNQEVEFYSTSNPDKSLVREAGTLDSFTIHANPAFGIDHSLRFIYGTILHSKDKSYFQELYKGDKYSLYKRFKSELGYNSNNYAEAELRQFDLQAEYYYSDSQSKGLNKIKPNSSSFIKEFKKVKDLSGIVSADAFTANPEFEMLRVMGVLNK